MRVAAGVVMGACLAGVTPAGAQSVMLEQLTWTEVRAALAAGTTTIIVPSGGVEQNGPHMALGKHNVLVQYKAEAVARRLGDALVAPVVAYVPEGDVDPPTGPMLFPGTVTTPADVFARVLEFAARSFKQHGFLDIALLGDSGGNQAPQRAVAEALNREWAGTPVRVHHVSDYFPGPADGWLRQQGEADADIGTHASIEDTSMVLAVAPAMIRTDRLAPGKAGDGSGVVGNPTRATVAYGRQLLELQVEAAVRQIRLLREGSRR
jgi:creatinine amidohydrolase/Fe(II)-dependent formamide hydrolase-like protein